MQPGPDDELTRLTTVYGDFSAHVLAARLSDEGIDVVLRGGGPSTYGVTVGALAEVQLLVPAQQLEEARYVLLVNDVEDALDDPPMRSRPVSVRVLAACVLLGLVGTPLARVCARLFSGF